MNKLPTNYATLLAVVSAVILAIGIPVIEFVIKAPYTFELIGGVVYFFLLFLLSHKIVSQASKKSNQIFIRTFQGVIGLKMFSTLIAIAIYIVVLKENAKVGAIIFVVLYLIYMALEVKSLMKVVKNNSSSKETPHS